MKIKCKSILKKSIQLFLIASMLNLSFSCISYQSAIVPKSQGISFDNTKNYYLIIESEVDFRIQHQRWEMKEIVIENDRISTRLYPSSSTKTYGGTTHTQHKHKLKAIYSLDKVGIGEARRKLLSLSQGEYIIFLDSDDLPIKFDRNLNGSLLFIFIIVFHPIESIFVDSA